MNRTAIKAGICATLLGSTMVLPVSAMADPAPSTTTTTTAPTATAESTTSPTPTTNPTTTTGTPTAGTPAAQVGGNQLAGKTIFLDPGHQGSADGHDLAKQVPDGYGGTKDCQTTGMTTLAGVPEHTINWNVSRLVESSLESLGAKVVLSRQNDTGWGGCVDERAKAANESGAQLAVSIHADSTSTGSDGTDHGFHLIVPQLPIPDAKANAAQSGPGLEASKIMRDAYVKAGFTPANYAGVQDGLQTRKDIAGPALTEVPDVFVEMGNGSNPADAQLLDSGDGQLKHAIAITTGIVTYLLTGNQGAAAPATTTAPSARSFAVTQQSDGTDTATTTTTAPPTTTTTTTPSGGGSAASGSGLLGEVFDFLKPLMQANGLGGLADLMNDTNLGTVSELAGKLFGILSNGGSPAATGGK
ncbi:N-acetylmuramoyl-L-alanine amidase [Speluncibacter jeojiensis]|uniref:N-acetylmuramoyl-L-alanine amidase n=1 Tax=Speluncibacter jeojiensis TaxID=2710754 RepID=UPI00240FEEAA|nr:N-acetylmuramoyl-L-alanine amidase [Rhodococcus sp. D2-41]